MILPDTPPLESIQVYSHLWDRREKPEPEIECEVCGGVDGHRCVECETEITAKMCTENEGLCEECQWEIRGKNGRQGMNELFKIDTIDESVYIVANSYAQAEEFFKSHYWPTEIKAIYKISSNIILGMKKRMKDCVKKVNGK